MVEPILHDQLIKKQQTINNGTSYTFEVNIPSGAKVYLRGYGYSWFDSCEFSLHTGNAGFPTRTDQEGSPSIPRIFEGKGYECRSGGPLRLTITNNSGSNQTFDVAFYLYTDQLLNEPSTGGALILATEAGSGTTSNVVTTSGSVTSLTNVEVSDNAAVGSSKGVLIAGQDGTNTELVKVDAEGRLDQAPINTKYPNELFFRNSDTDGGGAYTDHEITLTGAGTNRIVRDVQMYFPTYTDDAYFEVYDGNPASGGTLIGGSYYGAASFLQFQEEHSFTGNLWLRYKSGYAQTVYINARVLSD